MTEFKLVDVPDMNYTSKDIDPDTKKPTPRGKFYNIIWNKHLLIGEILIRGPGNFLGYRYLIKRNYFYKNIIKVIIKIKKRLRKQLTKMDGKY